MYPIVKTVGELSVSLLSDRGIRIQRKFNAARQLVWDAHTKPELLRCWLLGPPGWTMPVCQIDLRVGGTYRYEWHSERGLAMALSGTYRQIDVPSHIADTQIFDDNWTQGPADTDLSLEEIGARTLLILDIVYASKTARDFALSTPMCEGMEAGYARLEAVQI